MERAYDHPPPYEIETQQLNPLDYDISVMYADGPTISKELNKISHIHRTSRVAGSGGFVDN